MSLSIIVTTYNRPDALRLVLLALAKQTQLPNEVIVADDGSTEKTRHLINQLKTQVPYTLKQVWQEDKGFQAAKIRNKAVLETQGDYLIFLDGDCVPFPDFVKKHTELAESAYFVSGHRVLLNQPFTQQVLANLLPIYHDNFWQWIKYYFLRYTNSPFPLLRLALKRKRKSQIKRWQGVKSCNLGIWKKDFFAVNGFDESFVGWGYEDSDLAIRLIRSGILRKSGKFMVPVIHLWHLNNDRSQEKANIKLLQEIENSLRTGSLVGLKD